MGWVLLVLVSAGLGAVPLPSYRHQLATEEWYRVSDLIDQGLADDAIDRATRFQRQVSPDARLEYLTGLAWRRAGNDRRAERHYRRAVEMDPEREDAWYDLGELLVAQNRLDEAEHAFSQVARLVPYGTNSWLGPWRLAEVAAHRQDPERFEEHMREALRRGFSFRQIEGLPNWKAFYADPVMRDSVEKLVTVYGDRRTLDTL